MSDLAKVLKGRLLSPQLFNPLHLTELSAKTAAVYVIQSLYEFQQKQYSNNHLIQEAMWEEVFPLLDVHFFQLVPYHIYEDFLHNVLCAFEVAGHFDHIGKQLMQYIMLFFPKHLKRFRARRYSDRVLLPTVCCLSKCTGLEEVYLEKADSNVITTYLLAHILKYLNNLRVLALPKQCDDDVASTIGLNCTKLESLILTGTNVTNFGLSWLLCCKNLHTVLLPGFFQGITPKGVALLLNGMPSLRHVVYDVMSEVLTFIDFNASESILPVFGLKTVLFHCMELLSSNHLELVTKLCPNVEWLSLDSALYYDLEGLGCLPRLKCFSLNYKSRPIDNTVADFFGVSCRNLLSLHLIEVTDIHVDDLYQTVGECKCLENLVLMDCSFQENWDHPRAFRRRQPLSKSVVHIQLFNVQVRVQQLVDFLSLLKGLVVVEMDVCPLNYEQMKCFLLEQPKLEVMRCLNWSSLTSQYLTSLRVSFKKCDFQLHRRLLRHDSEDSQTMAATILSKYAKFSPLLDLENFSSN